MKHVLRKRRRGTVNLPWEFGGARLLALLSVRRWRAALVLCLAVVAGLLFLQKSRRFEAQRSTRIAIGEAQRAVAGFRKDFGRCPRYAGELLSPPRMREPYLKASPRDAWGKKLYIRCPAFGDPDGVDVVSAGPSQSFFEDDNIR